MFRPALIADRESYVPNGFAASDADVALAAARFRCLLAVRARRQNTALETNRERRLLVVRECFFSSIRFQFAVA